PDAGWVGNSYWFVGLVVQRTGPYSVLGTHLVRTSGGEQPRPLRMCLGTPSAQGWVKDPFREKDNR
ncbi:MAG: hypothetical protein NXI07_04710, partial [bacterium]|nr:hypothetical protein [bacterium]